MRIQKNISLKKYNTIRIDVKAKEFVKINSDEEIQSLISSGILKNKKFIILGGGSNILFTKNFDGIIVKINTKGKRVIKENSEHIFVKVSAGEDWQDFVDYCIENNFAGVENLSLIPGTVGAAPVQNIGAYGVELKDVFYELQAIEIESGETKKFTKSNCEFSYRNSIFKNRLRNRYVIISVAFKLHKHPKIKLEYGNIKQELEKSGIINPGIKEISNAICNIRRNKLPDVEKIGSAGSFFKNPVVDEEFFIKLKNKFPEIPAYELPDSKYKLAAGWLIEKTGLKGKTFGNAGIYKDQALVIVNHGGASSDEIIYVMEKIQKIVFEKFRVKLQTEVNII